jgi:hypothetical protein
MIRWFLQLFARISQWWRSRRRSNAFSGVEFFDHTVDPASALNARRLVLIGPAEKPKWLRFCCPCGCGEVLALNLMVSHSPRWKVELHPDGTLSASPSVDATACGAHFWIRRNAVKWVHG